MPNWRYTRRERNIIFTGNKKKRVRIADISIWTKMASPPFKNLCYDWFLAIVELVSLARSSVILTTRFLRIRASVCLRTRVLLAK